MRRSQSTATGAAAEHVGDAPLEPDRAGSKVKLHTCVKFGVKFCFENSFSRADLIALSQLLAEFQPGFSRCFTCTYSFFIEQVLSFFKTDSPRDSSPKRKYDIGTVKYVPRLDNDVIDDAGAGA